MKKPTQPNTVNPDRRAKFQALAQAIVSTSQDAAAAHSTPRTGSRRWRLDLDPEDYALMCSVLEGLSGLSAAVNALQNGHGKELFCALRYMSDRLERDCEHLFELIERRSELEGSER